MKSVVELCAGAGGQSIGLEDAGFEPEVLVEVDPSACETLRFNRPSWTVIEDDLTAPSHFSASSYKGVDLLSGGLPCPPFSIAGKQLGELDERNLFPAALIAIDESRPKAVMFENVRGLLSKSFDYYRSHIENELARLGYTVGWKLLKSSDFGVPQLRPRVVMVGLKSELADKFQWPSASIDPPTVGQALHSQMAANGWLGVDEWAQRASGIAPTLVGGSKKHGGPDLGPTRAKKAWAELGVDGRGLADSAPAVDFAGIPRLTVGMAATIQGFPQDWQITGRKTNAYRQVGNAFPPPVARSVATSIAESIIQPHARVKIPEGFSLRHGEHFELAV